jgi:uncharacterized protein (DUF302 family)
VLKFQLTTFLSVGIFLFACGNAFAVCPVGQVAVGVLCVNGDKVHYVKPGKEGVLQSVIDNAKVGDYIVLNSGNHYVTSSGVNTGLTIKGKKSLTVFGEEGAWVRTKDGWVILLEVADSEEITIQNVNLVHDVERGYCFGAVMKLSKARNIKIVESVMDGSGTQAVEMVESEHVEIVGGKAVRNTEGVFDIQGSSNIIIKNVLIADNDNSGHYKKGVLDINDSDNVSFFSNTIRDNKNGYFKKVTNSSNVYIKGNQLSNNAFESEVVSAKLSSDNGLVSVKSVHSVKDTVNRLESILLSQQGIKILAKLDHANIASRKGKVLRPSQLIVFTHPKAAFSLIQCQPTIALDLPQKLLVWEDNRGQVWVTYNNPEYLANRHQLACAEKVIKIMMDRLSQVTRQAAN